MSQRYDPLRTPKPKDWLALDEDERIHSVTRFHKAAREPLPNATVHACMHVVVENQAALGAETPVAEAIARLLSEGLDRHDAVHAVGAVFARHYFDMMKGTSTSDPDALRTAYFDEVRSLTAARWRAALEPD